MKYPVVLLFAARRDLSRLVDFLGAKSPRAANRARRLLKATTRSLADMPERVALNEDGWSRDLTIPFGEAGYVVRFRIETRQVVIVRFFHTREDR